MEIIEKDILLESSKSRLPGLIPSIEMGHYEYDNVLGEWKKINKEINPNDIIVYSNDDFPLFNDGKSYFSYGLSGKDGCNGNWNKFPCDINLTKVENFNEYINKTTLPLVKDKNGDFILRYRTMMTLYYWLMKFYKGLVFYKLCKRRNSETWVTIGNFNHFDESIKEFSVSLPNTDAYEINDIIGVSGDSNTFYSYFNGNYFNERIDKKFCDFVDLSIGKLEIPLDMDGHFVPDFLYYSEIKEWYDWLKNANLEDCCVKQKYEAMGGDKMKNFLFDKLSLFENTVKYFSKIVSPPYMNVSVFIPVEYDDMGEFSLYSQEWIGGNRYYVGEVAIYVSEDDRKGSSYVLTRGDAYELIEINKLFYENVKNSFTYLLIKKDNYDEIISACEAEIERGDGNFIKNNKKIIYCDSGNGKYYLPLAYFCGYFDEKEREIYFDVRDDNGKLKHWKENGDSTSIQNLKSDGYNDSWSAKNTDFNFKIESKLLSLRRMKKSYDDNGNELPGIIVYELINDNGKIKRIPKPNLEFIFESGQAYDITKVIDDVGNDADAYYGNVIEKITYANRETYANEGDSAFGEKKDDSNLIKFEYYIGSRLYENEDGEGNKYWTVFKDNENVYTGVKYVEIYNIEINKELLDVILDGTNVNFKYDEVDFESKYITTYNEDVDFAPQKTIISSATTKNNQLFNKNDINDTYNIINSLLYKEEYKMGVATPLKTDIDVYIDRGINAAFERHLILGEVNTYQDLENYRNNFFKFN